MYNKDLLIKVGLLAVSSSIGYCVGMCISNKVNEKHYKNELLLKLKENDQYWLKVLANVRKELEEKYEEKKYEEILPGIYYAKEDEAY